MRFLFLLLAVALLPACASTPKRRTAAIKAPSLASIQGDVRAAGAANGRARAAADREKAGLDSIRSDAQRIEDKAVRVLRVL